jgi:hypothetical protein
MAQAVFRDATFAVKARIMWPNTLKHVHCYKETIKAIERHNAFKLDPPYGEWKFGKVTVENVEEAYGDYMAQRGSPQGNFLDNHQNADILVRDGNKRTLAAIYMSPFGSYDKEIPTIFNSLLQSAYGLSEDLYGLIKRRGFEGFPQDIK